MAVTVTGFGTAKSGEKVRCWRLENASGMSVEILEYGVTVRTITVPDGRGVPTDVVLGYDTLGEYESQDGNLGAFIGRVCNRIGGAVLRLNGKSYALARNDGENSLHGGARGFDKRVFHGEADEAHNAVIFTRVSPDGEENYPGDLTVRAIYSLTDAGELRFVTEAETNADTAVNLTAHHYFNLNGGKGTVLGHGVRVNADRFTELDRMIPTGRLIPVEGTALDLRKDRTVGEGVLSDDAHIAAVGGGYDHNFCLNGETGTLREAVCCTGESGITMRVSTTLPGVQIYTANFLSDRAGKNGQRYGRFSGICFETQFWPDACNRENFPSVVLRAGKTYRHETVFAFSAR